MIDELDQIDPRELEARMRLTLLKLSVISEASGVRLGDVIHGGTPDRSPRGPHSSIAEYHRRVWRRAHSHEARCEALRGAQSAYIRARYAPRRSNVPGTLEWRLAIARDPRPAPVVAEVYGVSLRHVYNLRKLSRVAS